MNLHEEAQQKAVNHVMRFQTGYVDQNARMAIDAYLAALAQGIVNTAHEVSE